ncbi:MAG: hypothetical protein ACRD21_27930 [Vicinamibacteria bacterium]
MFPLRIRSGIEPALERLSDASDRRHVPADVRPVEVGDERGEVEPGCDEEDGRQHDHEITSPTASLRSGPALPYDLEMSVRILFCLLAMTLLALGCSGGSGGTDEAVSATVSDTQLLSEAESASNEVVRNASDCEAVSATFGGAMSKLDEVEGKLQTEVGRTTLATLRKQVTSIGEACGLR